MFKPDYRDSLYKRKGSNFLGRNDTYDGVKLTPTRYRLIPGAYEDKYNSDTYKILNNGVDDRSWSKRNSHKIASGINMLGAAGVGTAVALASVAPLAATGLALGGAATAIGGGISYLRRRNRRNKELQMKMIDASELYKKTKKHSFQKGNPYYENRSVLKNDKYKGHKLTHGAVQYFEPIYQDISYQNNMKYLTGEGSKNGYRSIGTTAGALIPAPFPISLINRNRQDREVQIEAIKLAKKLRK